MHALAERIAECEAEANKVWLPTNWTVGKRLAPLAGDITGIKDANGDFESADALRSLRSHAVDFRAVIQVTTQAMNQAGAATSNEQAHNFHHQWQSRIAQFEGLMAEPKNIATMVKRHAEWRRDELIKYDAKILQLTKDPEAAVEKLRGELRKIVAEMPPVDRDWNLICRQGIQGLTLPTPAAWSFKASVTHGGRITTFPICRACWERNVSRLCYLGFTDTAYRSSSSILHRPTRQCQRSLVRRLPLLRSRLQLDGQWRRS